MLLRFVAVYSIFDMLNLIHAAGLRGAGDTVYPMALTFVLAWIAMLVPAWVGCVWLGRGRLLRVDDREPLRAAARPADAAPVPGRALEGDAGHRALARLRPETGAAGP